VERALGLIAGAGTLPVLIGERARAQGWRVVTFAFAGGDRLARVSHRTIPSRLTDVRALLERLRAESVSAAVLCGRFAMEDVLRAEPADAEARDVERRAGGRTDVKLVEAVIATFAGIGVEVLDPRTFLDDLLLGAGCWSRRAPSDEERAEVRRGLGLARRLAEQHVGQTIVLRRGVVTAVEAAEGTTEAIRRGTALAGPGAVVVKAVARDHDYRVDAPAIGPETIAAAVAGRAAVVAVEAGRVLLLEREATLRAVDEAGLALVSVDVGG
jgi:DUF1009 family protein